MVLFIFQIKMIGLYKANFYFGISIVNAMIGA